MSTLDDLYRARAGHVSRQDENFLTASLGYLVNAVPEVAADVLSTFGEVAKSRAWSVSQEALFDAHSGRSVGRVDMALRWETHDGLRTLVVEAKLDSPVIEAQLIRYRDALGAYGKVVLLAREAPRSLPNGILAVTWDDLAAALSPRAALPGAAGLLVGEWLDFARRFEATRGTRLVVGEAVRGSRAAKELDAVDDWLARLLPQVLPGTVRGAVVPLLRNGDGDEDIGWYAEWSPSESRRKGGLAFRGLGLAATASAGQGLVWRCELLPRTKAIGEALVGDETLPWRKGWAREWLTANLGFTGATLPMREAGREVVERARAVLRAPLGLEDRRGFWVGASKRPLNLPETDVSVGDVLVRIKEAQTVRGAEELLSRRLVEALRDQAVRSGVPCRKAYHAGGSFYAQDGRFQIGGWTDAADPERPFVVWAWFREAKRAEELVEAGFGGWHLWRDPEHPRSVRASPTTPPDVLDTDVLVGFANAIGAHLAK